MMPFADTFSRLLNAGLGRPEADHLMGAIADGDLTDVQVAAVLGALASRPPSASELAGFVGALRRRMIPLPGAPAGAIDTCGTGGSSAPTLNTSTLAGLVASAAGAVVAKHGNRSASGRCGSLDVLETLGVELDLVPSENGRILARHHFCFANAREHHPALGRLGPLRRSLGVRTVFNLLGPLLNPAGVRRQLLGVSDPRVGPLVARTLVELEHEHAWVVCGSGGLDELSLVGPSKVWAVESGRIRAFELEPRALGLGPASPSECLGGDPDYNARRFLSLLDGAPGPAADLVVLNAAAALLIAGVAKDLSEGIASAREALSSGAAKTRFLEWKSATCAVSVPAPANDPGARAEPPR